VSLIDFDTKIKAEKITFKPPTDVRFWKGVAVTAQKEVRERTETQGEDAQNKAFTPYSKAYAELRREKGRSAKPNLSFTGKMLGGMRSFGRKGEAIVQLTGEQGFKAFQNEERGRVFFALSKEDIESIFRRVSKWVEKNNELK